MAKKEQPKSKKSSKTEKAVKSKEKEAKSKKAEGKALSPLEKARLAKASGKAPAKSAKSKKKAKLPTWKAPEEFKPHFIAIKMKTDKDGLLSSSIEATRYQGRYDPDADAKKKFDIGTYDPKTVNGILSRFAMTTFATNAAKRLPANTGFQVLIRVNKKSADGTLSVGVKSVEVAEVTKTGRTKLVALDKKDLNYRKFRKASRILPAAFKATLMPPKRTRGANKKSEGDDE